MSPKHPIPGRAPDPRAERCPPRTPSSGGTPPVPPSLPGGCRSPFGWRHISPGLVSPGLTKPRLKSRFRARLPGLMSRSPSGLICPSIASQLALQAAERNSGQTPTQDHASHLAFQAAERVGFWAQGPETAGHRPRNALSPGSRPGGGPVRSLPLSSPFRRLRGMISLVLRRFIRRSFLSPEMTFTGAICQKCQECRSPQAQRL